MSDRTGGGSSRFARRRLANWVTLGAAYSALYLARYNLSLVSEPLSRAYGWSRAEVGTIVSVGFTVYGLAAAANGPLVDRIGGRRAMLIGLAGAAAANAAVGLTSYSGLPASSLWWLLAALWAVNGAFQSFSALSLVKVNAAWFGVRERGAFSAILTGLIQCGRALVFVLGGVVLARASWAGMFVVPALVAAAAWVACRAVVRDTPTECGFDGPLDTGPAPVDARDATRAVLANPVVRAIGAAQLCTGIARHGFEQWFPRYLVEVQHLRIEDQVFRDLGIAVVAASVLGALAAGRLSDTRFGGRRAPAACAGYALQLAGCAAIAAGGGAAWLLAAFLAHAVGLMIVHSLLAGTAPMDFGGRAGAATAAGVFDGMHYLGGAIAGTGFGWLLDRAGWAAWAPAMMATSGVGLVLMLRLWRAVPSTSPPEPAPGSPP